MANRHERRKAEAERKAAERAEYLKERERRRRAPTAGASIGDAISTRVVVGEISRSELREMLK